MLSHEEAQAFYDRFGSKQDWQRFYEDRATTDLIDHASFEDAQSVFEFGCGTGRFAATLLAHHLPPTARYLAVDISSTMVALAQKRLGHFGLRVDVRLTTGDTKLDAASHHFDRFLSTYVLDLLSTDDIRALIAEARRVLSPGGLLGFVSLTHGCTMTSQLVEKVLVALHSLRPSLVAGCRPISLLPFLDNPAWHIRHQRQITRFGVPSEVVVVEKA